MEKDFESWIRQWQPDGQFPNARSPKLPFDVGMQNRVPPAVHCVDAIPSNCQSPTFGFLGLPNFERAQLDKPHGWLRFRQGVIPALVPSEKLLPKTNPPGKVCVFANENCGEINLPIAPDNGRAPKQFLVFDQSGDKTTVIFSSGIGTAIQLLGSVRPKATGNCNVNGNEIGVGSSEKNQAEPNLTNELDEGHGIDSGSEIHEDTEEINALLYSDDEDNYSEDGEETSTGHSPSTMTAYETQDWFEEDDIGEVASSAGPAKRQKLSDGNYEVASAPKIASSVKLNRSLEDEDDAESCCGGGELPSRHGNVGSLSGNKRARKEKICETISILQSIIPGGQGKDAVKVLDEAINYLRALRFKAESLGLSAF
uniref:BHLH domain-containing protein n=1 Tax=Opuntia streptacantha TaxID=393608 RepID=A0A7C9AEG6_OPUST